MDFPEVLSLLDPEIVTIAKLRKKTYDCRELVYLSDPYSSASVIAEDIICFGTVSQFNCIPDQYLKSGSFILTRDEPLKPLPSDISVVTCPNIAETRACYERLQAEFRAIRHMKESTLSLTLFASRGAGLKALVERISDLFDAPVNILDTSLAIVAHSDLFPIWVTDGAERGNGFLPEKAQLLMKDLGLVTDIRPAKTAVFSWTSPETGDLCYNHFTPISIGNTIIGSFSVFSQHAPLPRSRTNLMSTIANILSIEMQKTSSYLLNKSMYYSHLFDDLMSGQITESPEAIRYRFSIFGYPLRRYIRIIYVDLSGDYYDSSQTQALAERFHHELENNVYVVRDRNILLLTSTDIRIDEGITHKGGMLGEMGMDSLKGTSVLADSPGGKTAEKGDRGANENPSDANSLSGIEAIAKEAGVLVGVSSVFENILHAPTHVTQAQRAIETGRKYRPDDVLFLFSRYRMADLLSHLDDQRAIYSFRYPPLMLLIADDLKHSTALTYTLYVYLQNPSQPLVACKRLFIHKNTLYYRLDRIRAIMGVDIKDGWVLTQIMMTFLILMHQGKFEEMVLHSASKEDPQ